MSAANFIALFKSKRFSANEVSDYIEYNKWLHTNKTWFNKSREDLESMGLGKKVGFVISEDKANELGVGSKFRELADTFKNNKDIASPIVDIVDGKQVILFSDIPFKGGIESTLDKFFGKGTYASGKAINQVKGHVIGFMTGAILGAREGLYKHLTSGEVPVMGAEEADYTLNFLGVLIAHLERLDLESAGLKTLTSPIFAKYNKSSSQFLVELQTEKENAASAVLVQKLAGHASKKSSGIRGLINAQTGVNQTKILEDILDVLRKDGKFSNREIADFESSPSMKSLVLEDVFSALSTGKTKSKTYSGTIDTKTRYTILHVNKEAKDKYRSTLKRIANEAKNLRVKVAKNKIVSKPVVNLQLLLQSRLQEQLVKNMGTGNARNVLNYRTGRFAASASIDRITTSREGMVSVFYNYMRNPYGTFSEGGLQQSPRTRDPKTLISKSIREIGASLAYNRMRAVLV
jgi:hypothetical protein